MLSSILVIVFVFRLSRNQGWQYGTEHSEFAYYVPRTLNHTSVPHFLEKLRRTVSTYRTALPFMAETPTVILQIFSNNLFNYLFEKVSCLNVCVVYHIYSLCLGKIVSMQETKGVRKGGVGGSNPPHIGLSTKMHTKENITFLALLSLFFCNDMDSNMI